MKISEHIDIAVKTKLANGGEEIFDIGNGEYLQVISDLSENVFKILFLSETKPKINTDNVISQSLILSNQTQEVIDNNKYMISIIERLDDYHYTKFTHIDHRGKGILSYLFDLMEGFKPIKKEWTERLSVYNFLLNKGFKPTHIMNYPSHIGFCDDEFFANLAKMEEEKEDKFPYKVYVKIKTD